MISGKILAYIKETHYDPIMSIFWFLVLCAAAAAIFVFGQIVYIFLPCITLFKFCRNIWISINAKKMMAKAAGSYEEEGNN